MRKKTHSRRGHRGLGWLWKMRTNTKMKKKMKKCHMKMRKMKRGKTATWKRPFSTAPR